MYINFSFFSICLLDAPLALKRYEHHSLRMTASFLLILTGVICTCVVSTCTTVAACDIVDFAVGATSMESCQDGVALRCDTLLLPSQQKNDLPVCAFVFATTESYAMLWWWGRGQ